MPEPCPYRIGQGYDAHRFSPGRALILGGTVIPHDQGLLAHSDGDVLVHALCDALLGAGALGDIGHHFPDSDPRYAARDSRILLREVVSKLRYRSLAVVNADMTVIAQHPKLAPFLEEMRGNLCADLKVSPDCVNIKATTTEGMGFTGRGEGVAACAVVLLSLGMPGTSPSG